jgi:hypothetical protein
VSRAAAGLGLALALALAGCRPDPAPRVEGEWVLELTIVHPGSAPAARPGQRVAATLVIDPRVADVYESLSGDSVRFTPGREYLDRRRLYDAAAPDRPYPFRDGLHHDLFEEALARVDGAGRFHAWLTPGSRTPASSSGERGRTAGPAAAGFTTGTRASPGPAARS